MNELESCNQYGKTFIVTLRKNSKAHEEPIQQDALTSTLKLKRLRMVWWSTVLYKSESVNIHIASHRAAATSERWEKKTPLEREQTEVECSWKILFCKEKEKNPDANATNSPHLLNKDIEHIETLMYHSLCFSCCLEKFYIFKKWPKEFCWKYRDILHGFQSMVPLIPVYLYWFCFLCVSHFKNARHYSIH